MRTKQLVLGCLMWGSMFADAQESVYVPVFYATTSTRASGTESPTNTYWLSVLGAFNTNAATGRITLEDTAGVSPVTSLFCQQPFEVSGHTGRDLQSLLGCVDIAGRVGFVRFGLTPGMLVSGSVERVDRYEGCLGLNPLEVGQGRAQLPVFSSLLPAGSRSLLGDINLGAPELPGSCAGSQTYQRRVNLTLFNAGESPATVQMRVLPLRGSSTPLLEQSYTLAPKEVRQINRLPIPLVHDQTTSTAYDVRVWIQLTSDQLYLAYASSIFADGQPDSLPFEVFPAHLAP